MPRQLPSCGIHPHIYEVLWEARCAASQRSQTGLHLVQVDKQDVISTQLLQLKNVCTDPIEQFRKSYIQEII